MAGIRICSRYPPSKSPRSQRMTPPLISQRSSISSGSSPSGQSCVKMTSLIICSWLEFRIRNRTVTSSPTASASPRMSARTTGAGGRRSARPTGLKLIQKIARSGKITTRATAVMVGIRSPQARRASLRARGPVPVGGVAVVIISLRNLEMRGDGNPPPRWEVARLVERTQLVVHR